MAPDVVLDPAVVEERIVVELAAVLDLVVTDRERVPVEAVDSDLTAATVAWADAFTADHREAVDAVVRTLYPDHYADAGGWCPAAAARIEELRDRQQQNRERTQRQLTADDLPDDIEATSDLDVLNAAIEAVDVRDVARAVADSYDTAPGRDPVRFDPPWRGSSTGTSCFVDREKWFDLDGRVGGGALTLVGCAAGIISPGDDLRGEDYWKAVNKLRGEGFDVPYFTGRDGFHADGLRLYEDDSEEDADRRAIRAVLASGLQGD